MTRSNPRPLGSRRDHYWMALRMAQSTGADLQTALDSDFISQADWAELVERCRACDWADGCDCWMSAQIPGGAEVPQACPNAPVFERVLSAEPAE